MSEAVLEAKAPSEPTPASDQTPPDPAATLDQMATAALTGDTQEYARLEALLKTPAAEAEPEPEPAPVIEEPVATAQPEAEPEIDTAPEEQPGATPVPEKEPDRFRFKDAADRAVAMLAKAKGISLVDAAKLYAGEPVAKVEPVVAQAPQADPTITALETRAEELKAKIREAGKDERLLDSDYAEASIEFADVMAELKAERRAAKTLSDVKTLSEADRTAQSEAQIKAQWQSHEQAVVKDYPDMAKADSPMALMAAGLARAMQSPNHPDHEKLYGADAPRFLADKAAQLLGKVPQNVPRLTAKTAAQPVARPAPGSRTTTAPAVEKSIEQQIADENAETDRIISGGYRPRTSGIIIL